MSFKLEVIAFNIESCAVIEASGAHRIELCDNPGEGGTTPSAGFIQQARKKCSIELYPIIRPRGGDFLYTEEEFECMKTDIIQCKKAGCDGVVIGMLMADGSVDTDRCSRLVSIAYPMGVTFHRAFDRVADPVQALEDVIKTGCERILTSGLRPQASDGAAMIKELIAQANERICIKPGSGIRSNNIASLVTATGAVEFHSSARISIPGKMEYKNQFMNEQLFSISADESEIVAMINALKNCP